MRDWNYETLASVGGAPEDVDHGCVTDRSCEPSGGRCRLGTGYRNGVSGAPRCQGRSCDARAISWQAAAHPFKNSIRPAPHLGRANRALAGVRLLLAPEQVESGAVCAGKCAYSRPLLFCTSDRSDVARASAPRNRHFARKTPRRPRAAAARTHEASPRRASAAGANTLNLFV